MGNIPGARSSTSSSGPKEEERIGKASVSVAPRTSRNPKKLIETSATGLPGDLLACVCAKSQDRHDIYGSILYI